MAVPKKKTSKSKTKARKTTWKQKAMKQANLSNVYFSRLQIEKKKQFAMRPRVKGFF